MLELGKIANRNYEIMTEEGQVLHIGMPTKDTFEKMASIGSSEGDIVISEIYNIFNTILNHNIEGHSFSHEYTDRYDIGTIELVLTDYLDFVTNRLGE